MAQRWTDKPAIDTIEDADLVLLADMSLPEGQRDTTALVSRFRAWLQTGLTEWGTITGTLSDQADLWDALMDSHVQPIRSVTISGSNEDAIAGDAFGLVLASAPSDYPLPVKNFRLPGDAQLNFVIGTRIEVLRTDDHNASGAGTMRIIGNGATVLGFPVGGNIEQGQRYTCIKTAASEWWVSR